MILYAYFREETGDEWSSIEILWHIKHFPPCFNKFISEMYCSRQDEGPYLMDR